MLSRVCEMFLHSSVCLSVCPSVHPIQPLHAAATGLLLWSWQPGYIYRSWRGWQVDGQQQAQCSGMPHPDAGITTLSADMGSWTPESCSLLFQQNIGGTVIASPLIAEWSTLVTLCPRIYFWNYMSFSPVLKWMLMPSISVDHTTMLCTSGFMYDVTFPGQE